MPIHTYVNAETGESNAVEMVGDELQEYLENTKKAQAELVKENERVAAKEAVLAKLGLTTDEVAALLG